MEAQVAPARARKEREASLLDVCEQLVKLAKKAGASDSEAYAERTRESSVKVRDGNVEELQQATSKGVGLRVFSAGRLGFAYGTDFSKEGLRGLAQSAVSLAKGAAKDQFNELPRGGQLGRGPEGEYDPAIEDIDPAWKLRAAHAAERAAGQVDRRVRKFDSTGAGDFLASSAIASSRGASGESRASYAYVYCSPVAEADGQLQTASWSDTRRRLSELQAPEEVGRIAAQRAARMLGARKVKTQKAAIIFEPQQAAGFLAGLSGAVNGDLGCTTCTACRVTAWDDICLFTPFDAGSGGQFATPIFLLTPDYAGLTVTIDIWDVGDITSTTGFVRINILDPTGAVATSPLGINIYDLGQQRSNLATRNYTVWASAPGNTVASFVALDTSRGIYADNQWIHLEIPIPSTYNPPPGQYWSMQYVTGAGTVTYDTVTVAVSLKGGPVHLVS